MSVWIQHNLPIDIALADIGPSRPERDEPIDLRSLVTVGGSDVEMEPVLRVLLGDGWTAPGDLGTGAVRRPDRGLLVLIPDQRPSERGAPEVPDLLRTIAVDRSDAWTVGEEVVGRLDDAELVALGVGEHDMFVVRALNGGDVAARGLGARLSRPEMPWTSARLAKAGGTNPVQLQRAFRDVLGLSPRDYVVACRRKRFLETVKTGQRVTDAIYSSGFGSPSRSQIAV